jgi:RHS repeat-associated protein
VYVRDASGNTMSIYKKTASVALAQTETDVYGSSRLGLLNQLTVASQTQTLSSGYGEAIISTFTRGEKLFELSNHLGNVLVTVTDKKLQHNTSSDTVDYYLADVATAQDYYPFGMQQPGRTYTNGSQYRYGFNGKEKDKDISEGGQDYGMRIYDTRIGRFLSVDPLAQSYPWNSTYAFAENKVVHCKDLDGGEAKYYVIDLNADYPVLTYYKTKDFSWIPNFLEPDVASVEVLGLNVTYTFLNASSGKNSLWSFENVFQKDPIAAIYSGEYATDADIMGNAVYDLAFALLAGRAASLSPAKNKSSTGMNGSYFAQKKINSNRQFSPEGQAKYSKLAGSKIKTTTDLSAAIKNKKIKVEDVTVDYVMKNGKKVILNSRTSAALEDAGIPMDKWVGVDQTGVKVPGMDNKTFDDLANEQIKRNYKPGEELSTKVPESAKEPPKN